MPARATHSPPVTTATLVPLAGTGAPVDQVGSKGAWLDRLAAAGFPVPSAHRVPTGIYEALTSQPGLAEFIADLRKEPLDDPRRFPEFTDRVDAAFLEASTPPLVHDSLASSAALAATGPVAVRSSATAEDLGDASYAGQYRSFLNLEDEAAVSQAICLVWASLWHPAPILYRRLHGIDSEDLAMAVVVMPMVSAERAGVAFTRDPQDPSMVRVETVSGLGERLVSGQVTPTVSLIPRDAIRTAGEVSVLPDSQDSLAVEVTALGLRVEETFGAPQDLEWAWTGSHLTLLQARLITTTVETRDAANTISPPDERWTTAAIAEMLPGVLPPLTWDTAGFYVEQGFRELFAALGAADALPPNQPLIGRFRGRAALSRTALSRIAEALPGGSPDEVERQYFGRSARQRPVTTEATRAGKAAMFRHSIRVTRLNRRAGREAETTTASVADLVANPPPLPEDSEALRQLRARMLHLGGRTIAAEIAVAAGATASYRRLEAWLARRLGDSDAQQWAQRLTSTGITSVWWQPPAGPSESEEVVDLRERAGRAGSKAIFGGPTWVERPDLLEALVGASPSREDSLPRVWTELLEVLQHHPDWTDCPFEAALDTRLIVLRRLVEDCRELQRRRERTKPAVLSLGGVLRRAQLALGKEFAEHGRLDEAADIYLLRESELATGPPAPIELLRRRRWVAEYEVLGPLPPVFTGEPPMRRPATSAGADFHGWGASAGHADGPALLAHHPNVEIEPGQVLVAATTDASWSPLFGKAAAIVVEEGGPLSHAAIVARELGIPAVLNVTGVCDAVLQLNCDTVVSVDGDRGEVTLS